MNYYEDVHKRAEELAKIWYEDPKNREDVLKELIMKELHTKGYWHFIKLDQQKAELTPVESSVKCTICTKVKELFK